MHHRRAGFTLVELLVAMFVTIFILMLLAQAFALGTDLFRQMKAVGDLNSSLRTAAVILRSDLAGDHFEGKRRTSDSKFWDPPYNGTPQQGYLFLFLPPTGADEPGDADGLPNRRRIGHIIAGTTRARGNRQQDYYSVPDPAGIFANLNPDGRFQQPGNFNSQWIEFCYFLAPVLDANNSASGTPLYALYRQQRLVVADVDQLNWGAKTVPVAQYDTYKNKISLTPKAAYPGRPTLYFNSPSDLTIPERRNTSFAPIIDPVTNAPSGEDLLLMDVVSFDVQVLLSNASPTDTTQLQFRDLPAASGFKFDTWSQRIDDLVDYSTKVNTFTIAPRRLLALQITLRIWDAKSKTTRQVTIVQDL